MIYDQLCSRFEALREYDRANLFFATDGRIALRIGLRMLGGASCRTLEIADVMVPAAMRRQGVFRSILRDCEQFTRTRGLDAMYVENVYNPDLPAALLRYGYTRRIAYGEPLDVGGNYWKLTREVATHG